MNTFIIIGVYKWITSVMRYVSIYQHGSWCINESVSPLIKGLGFEPWQWKKSYWERHFQMGPAARDPNLVGTLQTPNTRWETKEKKRCVLILNHKENNVKKSYKWEYVKGKYNTLFIPF